MLSCSHNSNPRPPWVSIWSNFNEVWLRHVVIRRHLRALSDYELSWVLRLWELTTSTIWRGWETATSENIDFLIFKIFLKSVLIFWKILKNFEKKNNKFFFQKFKNSGNKHWSAVSGQHREQAGEWPWNSPSLPSNVP